MSFVLIIIGVFILVAGVRGTQNELWQLLQGDFSPSQQKQGQHSFTAWFLAILIIGAVGYVKDLRSLSRAFLALIIIVLFLSNGGFFANFFSSLGISSGSTGTMQQGEII